jgi:hypothetical protein
LDFGKKYLWLPFFLVSRKKKSKVTEKREKEKKEKKGEISSFFPEDWR